MKATFSWGVRDLWSLPCPGNRVSMGLSCINETMINVNMDINDKRSSNVQRNQKKYDLDLSNMTLLIKCCKPEKQIITLLKCRKVAKITQNNDKKSRFESWTIYKSHAHTLFFALLLDFVHVLTLYLSLQLHIVHWNEKMGSFGDAASQTNGLAVLGVLIQVQYNHLIPAPVDRTSANVWF